LFFFFFFCKYSNACAPYEGDGVARSVLSYGSDDRGIAVRCPEGQEIYVISKAPTPVPGPAIPAVHWYRGRVLQMQSGGVVKLTTQPHIMLRLRMSVALPPLSRNTNKMQLCNRIYYSRVFLNAHHVSSGTPLIIRSSKLFAACGSYAQMVTGRYQGCVGTGSAHSTLVTAVHHMGI